MRSMIALLPALLLVPLLAACAVPAGLQETLAAPDAALPDVLLLGEQHDAPSHRSLQRRAIEILAGRGRLAAVALEMVEQGHSTGPLARDASEDSVRKALEWNAAGWDWPTYAPVVMAAVRAGVPVFGANLPRARMREAMRDAQLDDLLPGAALKAQQQAIRSGHCGLLPESQIMPMTRVQIARDRAMAQVVANAAVPGKTVVLVAGGGHVEASLGVPLHVPPYLKVQPTQLPPEPATKDHCEGMRRQLNSTGVPAR
jgi:uncharacterized iron-regulated protein